MTPEERARLRELCNKVTPGPWTRNHAFNAWFVTPDSAPGTVAEANLFRLKNEGNQGGRDAAFIAAARTALPALLDALNAAEARIAAVEALCEEARTEAVGGGRTDVDTLWPSDIVAALAGKRKP